MYLDTFIKQRVHIKFKNFPKLLVGPMTGIFKPESWYAAKLIHTESYGIWVENPCYKRTKIQDHKGVDIPPEEQKEEECTIHLLIRWEYIDSIIAFPHEEAEGVDKEAKLIGFHS